MDLANAVVMVEPRDFGFNDQTALDNAFQHHPDESSDIIRTRALSEFWHMVELLDKHHLDVLPLTSPEGVLVPDAVFPNNWFSTTDSELIIYPMKTLNRQQEIQINQLTEKLQHSGYSLADTIELQKSDQLGGILEGTGVLVIDHHNNEIYSNISERCETQALQNYAELFDYTVWPMHAVTSFAVPVYHTNVLMAVGLGFTVIARDILSADLNNSRAIERLYETKQDVIEITEEQMIEGMCGNILQLQSRRGESLIVMSESARKSFTNTQLQQLEKHGSLVPVQIDTIEYVGGGSARCMLAEIFLQKA